MASTPPEPGGLEAAVEAFKRGEGGYKTLAKRYGVSRNLLRKTCREQGLSVGAGPATGSMSSRSPATPAAAAAPRAAPPPKPSPTDPEAIDLDRTRADQARIVFLAQEIAELDRDIEQTRKDGKAHTMAYRYLRQDRAKAHAELDELRVAEQAAEAERRARDLAQASHEERLERLARYAAELPLDALEVFVQAFIDRHEGRAWVVVDEAGDGSAPAALRPASGEEVVRLLPAPRPVTEGEA